MNFSERIEAVMRHYKLQAKEMADLCGVQRTAISHILSGRNRPSVGFLGQLSEAFPELNTRWLLHGKGAMFTSVTNQEQESSETSNSSVKPQQRDVNQEVFQQLKPVTNVETNVTKSEVDTPPKFEGAPSDKHVIRVVLLYSDGTFSSYDPNQE